MTTAKDKEKKSKWDGFSASSLRYSTLHRAQHMIHDFIIRWEREGKTQLEVYWIDRTKKNYM